MKQKKKTKGQASIEYLVTYGWAILMIALVGILMWQMGVFKPPSPPPDCRGFAKIKPLDWVYNPDPSIPADSHFTLMIINEGNTRLRIGVSDVRVYIEGAGECTEYEPDFETNISAGEKLQMNLSSCPTMQSGNYYRAKINITYKNIVSNLDHVSTGTCWAETQ